MGAALVSNLRHSYVKRRSPGLRIVERLGGCGVPILPDTTLDVRLVTGRTTPTHTVLFVASRTAPLRQSSRLMERVHLRIGDAPACLVGHLLASSSIASASVCRPVSFPTNAAARTARRSASLLDFAP